MNWLQRLTPPNIQELVPYSSARREASDGDVWLNANENPFPRKSKGAFAGLNRYPEFQPVALLKAYASYAGVSIDQVLITRGIDEGLDILIRSFCSADDQIIYTPPTYGMYRITAETLGVQSVATALLPGWKLDMPQVIVEAGDSKIAFLCSPNNPTGNVLKRSKVLDILEATRNQTLIVLDEAYIEFVPESSYVDLLSNYPHLIILRTLSKAFGLAGLRCGFVLANPAIIAILKKVTPPYPIPIPAVEIATAALSAPGIATMKSEVKLIQDTRADLEASLNTFSFVEWVAPSDANFLLIKVKDASELMTFLQQKGIVIRNRSSQTLLENCVRITVGSAEEMELLLTEMKAYEAQV
ncbi:MAG: histidinol-phosphate transaminase [Candidatus Marinimicrobia bacterium]|nr:histidinol-phosphate transaminase [Candidatus Neomarinimicrobiota bacterium]